MQFDATLFTTAYQIIGLPAALLLIYWIAVKWMKNLGAKISDDRAEHVRKWDSMIESHEKLAKLQSQAHRDEIERMFSLHERQTKISEMQAVELIRITESIRELSGGVDDLADRLKNHITIKREQEDPDAR